MHNKKYYLPLGFAVPLALMVALIFIGLYSMIEIQNRLITITENHNVKSSLVTAMRYAARERTISLYRMVTLTDPFEKDDEFMRFNHHGAEFANSRTALLNMDLTAAEREVLAQQGELTASTVDSQNQIVDLATGDRVEEAVNLLFEVTVPAQETVFAKLTDLLNMQKHATHMAAREAAQEYERAKTLMVLCGGVAVLLGLIVAIVVVRRTVATEQILFLEKERAQVTLHSIGEGVITTDANGNIDYLNPVAEALTGWDKDEAKGLPLLNVFKINNDEGGPVQSPVILAMSESRIVNTKNHSVLNRNQGKYYAIEQTAGPIKDHKNNMIGAVLVFRNVTDIRDMARQMSYQATHDTLTGLINRSEFERRLGLALKTVNEKQSEHVLCYLDLDEFKVVNDTCGHVAGDELLKKLVELMLGNLRRTDTLARLGGDEFGLLMVDCDVGNAVKRAEKLRENLHDFRFNWDGRSFTVGVSVGLVALNQQSGTITDVLSAADSACYVAKDLGKDRIHVYQPDDQALTLRQGEMQWLPRIREALEQDLFCLYCQRIVPLGEKNAGMVRYEILVRMLNQDGSIVPPIAFIPAAERYHLMSGIDRWVIQTALAFIYTYQQQYSDVPQSWAINLSGQSICDDDFLNFIIEKIKSSRVIPETICFEITETAAVKNLNRAIEFMTILKRLGCRFSLDDFGSGLSSFTYLKNLPVDYLKIDGSFVKDMLDDRIDLAMVKSINQIGHTMGLETIAEFVENQAIQEQLRLMRVDYAQGYGIHKPEPMKNLMPASRAKIVTCQKI